MLFHRKVHSPETIVLHTMNMPRTTTILSNIPEMVSRNQCQKSSRWTIRCKSTATPCSEYHLDVMLRCKAKHLFFTYLTPHSWTRITMLKRKYSNISTPYRTNNCTKISLLEACCYRSDCNIILIYGPARRYICHFYSSLVDYGRVFMLDPALHEL